jgi:hypothetical protein
MATLTPTLTLASTDISASETLNLTLTDSLSVLGPVKTERVTIAASETELLTNQTILDASAYSKSYVLLYNTSTAASGEIITVGTTDNDETADDALEQEIFELAPGEFAFFPWNAVDTVNDLMADASSGSPVLEIRIYQAAA